MKIVTCIIKINVVKKKAGGWCFQIDFLFCSVNGCGTLLPIMVTTDRIRGIKQL